MRHTGFLLCSILPGIGPYPELTLYYGLNSLTDDFGAFVQELYYQKDRANLKPGRVPASEFWLIDDDEFIGRLSLRHELNEYLLKIGGHIGYEIRPSKRRQGYGTAILRLGLEKARELDLHRVFSRCHPEFCVTTSCETRLV